MSENKSPKRTAGSQATWTALAAIYPNTITPQDLVTSLNTPDVTIRHVNSAVTAFVNRGFAIRTKEPVINPDGSDGSITVVGLTKKGALQAKLEGMYVEV